MLNLIASIDAAGWAGVGAGVGVGLAVLGAGLGIGKIGGNAVQATARQPEAASQVFLQMLIAAALIEGVAFFGVISAAGAASGFNEAAAPAEPTEPHAHAPAQNQDATDIVAIIEENDAE